MEFICSEDGSKYVFFRENWGTKNQLYAVFPIKPENGYVCFVMDNIELCARLFDEADLGALIGWDTWRAKEEDYLPFWKEIEKTKGWKLALLEDENLLIVAEKKFLLELGWVKDMQLSLFLDDARKYNEEDEEETLE